MILFLYINSAKFFLLFDFRNVTLLPYDKTEILEHFMSIIREENDSFGTDMEQKLNYKKTKLKDIG
ncbi:MAG: hypothetical protein ACRD90_04470 [Nitrosopumilaceae archaeon]